MDVQQFVDEIDVIELSAATGSTAIRELVAAVDWTDENISPNDIVKAIEEREAAAQTIVDEGLALPHALIDWTGELRVVLGRSKVGVDYGATGKKLHLIILLVVGKGHERLHLEALAALAELLSDSQLRQELISARNTSDIRQRLADSAAQPLRREPPVTQEIPQRSSAVVHHAVGLAESLSAQAILLATDLGESVPWGPLCGWEGRLLMVTSKNIDDAGRHRSDTHFFEIPHTSLSRMDRANLGLLLAAAEGLVDHEREVVCITGPRGRALDSITVTRPAAHFRAVFPESEKYAKANISPAVILRVLSLAIELASEGREAHPVGVIFVVGDTRQVLRHTQQLVLNPFHGFARRLRNVFDPSLTETVKEFALLDGAFIVDADGTLCSAGTYLVPKYRVTDLPGGLGARHQAAAAITAQTSAMSITVSQSTGTVTLFQDGRIVLALERATLTRW